MVDEINTTFLIFFYALGVLLSIILTIPSDFSEYSESVVLYFLIILFSEIYVVLQDII